MGEGLDVIHSTAADLAAAIAAGETTSVGRHRCSPGPDRHRRRRGQRLPARRRRAGAGSGRRHRPPDRRRGEAGPAGRRAARAQGHPRLPRCADDLRFEDPRGLDPAVRRHGHAAAAGRRSRHPRQDQPGRVRDGLLDRELRVRTHPQPVGHHPDPRRLGRRERRCAGRLRGAAGHRHRHRWLDPSTRLGHRHGRRQADLWRHLPLRRGGHGLLAGPARTLRPHGARRRPAARGDRRSRPAGLDLHRRAGAAGRRGRALRRRVRASRSAWSRS